MHSSGGQEIEGIEPYRESNSPRVFPCRSCGAALKFDPTEGLLACSTCGASNSDLSSQNQETEGVYEEKDFREHLARQAGNEPALEQLVVECPQCGAKTIFDQHVTASSCSFCTSPIVASDAHSERLIRPQGIVPFRLTTKEAQKHFKEWVSSRWFAPGALKERVSSVDGARGVYIPCWTFDAATSSDYLGLKGVSRVVFTTGRDSNGNTVVKPKVVTTWFPAAGNVQLYFDDELILASESIPSHLADVLSDWESKELSPASEDYMAGFVVEAYQTGLEDGFSKAKEAFKSRIRQAIRRDIGGTHQQIFSVSTSYQSVQFKHILLPVWVASYKFKDKVWRVVINGQTGKVKGDRPWSAWKIASAVLAVSALAVIVIQFLQNS